MSKTQLTLEKLNSLRVSSIEGKIEANKLLNKGINKILQQQEVEKCKNDIIYFKDNYLINLKKIKIQDDMLNFILNKKISEINTGGGTYRTKTLEIIALHKLLFSNKRICVKSVNKTFDTEIISDISLLLNELPTFLRKTIKKSKYSIKNTNTNSSEISILEKGKEFDVLLLDASENLNVSEIIQENKSVINSKIVIFGLNTISENTDNMFTIPNKEQKSKLGIKEILKNLCFKARNFFLRK